VLFKRFLLLNGSHPMETTVMHSAPYRKLRIALYAGAALLLANVATWTFSTLRAQDPPSQPYTAVLVEQTFNPDGVRRIGSIRTIARRSDGSTAFKLGPEGQGSRRIISPSGEMVEVNDNNRAKTTMKFPPPPRSERDPANLCRPGSERNAPVVEETLGQLRVARLSKVLEDRTSSEVLALDYDCITVGGTMNFSTGAKSELSLLSFTPGEPSEALFTTGAGYKEGPPSALWDDAANASCYESCQSLKKRRDEEYARLRAK
jgi:hypothetical protein